MTGAGSAIADWRDYWELLKPRVMWLSLFTAVVGLVAAPQSLDPVLAAVSVLAIALGAGAAGALNMWFDADIDRRMARTRSRPIPAGRIAPGEALGFGLALAVAAVTMLGLFVDWAAAGLLAVTIAFYVVIYSMWLKRRTPQNIVIGGAAGALPPVVGYTAAQGGVTPEALVLFLIIFLWTPPHFWALALKYADDYAAAGIPMLPNTAGRRATTRQILLYTLVLLPVGMLPAWWMAGPWRVIYALLAAGMGLVFVYHALALHRREKGGEMRLFTFSILYLFGLFLAVMAGELAGGGA
ncbi:MAG: protoheme IX farnesyltransferase [Alphaproteobacteria bacterium]|nr:MAG: protoheme IX farnesyltransferase [Alphaproteobacteria bacterium]